MDPRSLDNTSASIADIVTADKLDAVSAGIVKDDESQSLSALSEKESALGKRTTHNASPSKERMRKSLRKETPALHPAHGKSLKLCAPGKRVRRAQKRHPTRGIA